MNDRLKETFTELELDAIHEMLNIAMGRAANAIACLMDVLVEMSLPLIRFDRLGNLMREAIRNDEKALDKVFIRQSFYGPFKGEVLAAYDRDSCRHISMMMGLDGSNSQAQDELLLDLSSVLIGACMNCFTELMDIQLGYSAPSILPPDRFRSILNQAGAMDLELIVLEVHMAIKNHPIASDLIIGMSAESMLQMKERVASFTEKL
ncbi:MAG: hypothetical protein HYV16_11405 [Gammaproteobacteria bacterium]|nr:hypothetical protein [Gammaproteobacteria bacterium]